MVHLTGGDIEPGLETFLKVLNVANAGNLNINFTEGKNIQKVFIMITNEDSDPPVTAANVFSSNGQSQDQTWLNDHCYPSAVTNPPPCTIDNVATATPIPAITWADAWQLEVNAVANSLIDKQASVYMFVPGSATIARSCPDPNREYGFRIGNVTNFFPFIIILF